MPGKLVSHLQAVFTKFETCLTFSSHSNSNRLLSGLKKPHKLPFDITLFPVQYSILLI